MTRKLESPHSEDIPTEASSLCRGRVVGWVLKDNRFEGLMERISMFLLTLVVAALNVFAQDLSPEAMQQRLVHAEPWTRSSGDCRSSARMR